MNPIAIAGALAIGLSLGLTGAGGSILTLPALVYLAHVPPEEAVGISLIVVGSAALIGGIQRIRSGGIHTKAAFVFGTSGMAGAYLGSQITPIVPAMWLMVIFAVLMLTVAGVMLFKKNQEAEPTPNCQPMICTFAGLGTGILTGFIGVGGGFLLVPALMRYAHLPIRTATGTSLMIIAMNSTVGWLSHGGWNPDYTGITLTFAACAIAGVLVSKGIASKLPAIRLRQGFAFIVLLTGGLVLWQSFASP